MKRVLIIEDDQDIAELERDYLEANGFTATLCGNGLEGEKLALAEPVDIIVLDIMLPGEDGFQVCRNIRQHKNIPILLVSARQEDIDKIRGLGLGADDYIVKPFSPNELVARVKAHLSRYEQLTAKETATQILRFGDLAIDEASHRVFVHDQEVLLPNKEFELLLFWLKIQALSLVRIPYLTASGELMHSAKRRPLRSTSIGFVKKSKTTRQGLAILKRSGAQAIAFTANK